MEGSNRGTVIMIVIMIGALAVALIGIGSIIVGIVNGGTIQSVLGGNPLVSANDTEITPEETDPLSLPPIRQETDKEIDYAFATSQRTYNANSIIASAKKIDIPSPTVTSTIINPPKITTIAQPSNVQVGVRDQIVTAEAQSYTNTLVSNQLTTPTNLASIQIPSLGINSLITGGGDGDAALDVGMWLYPTSNSKEEKILLCHRRFFGPNDPRSCWYMDRVKMGDLITIFDKNGVKYTYKIINQGVREESDLAIFKAGDDDIVKIITCTPLGSSTHRLITIASRID